MTFKFLAERDGLAQKMPCVSIMFNQNGTNTLIELNSRTWWSDKKETRPAKKTVNAEESLPYGQSNCDRETIVPPEAVFFVIEFA